MGQCRFSNQGQIEEAQSMMLEQGGQIAQIYNNVQNNNVYQQNFAFQHTEHQRALEEKEKQIQILKAKAISLEKQVVQLNEMIESLAQVYTIKIYFTCGEKYCRWVSEQQPFWHTCGKEANFSFNGQIKCEGKCKSFHLREAFFNCYNFKVGRYEELQKYEDEDCSVDDPLFQQCQYKIKSKKAKEKKIVKNQLQLAQIIERGLKQSKYSEEEQLRFSVLVANFPFYFEMLISRINQ